MPTERREPAIALDAATESAYLERLVPPRAPGLLAMEDFAHRVGFPIIGPACGHFCYLLARLMGARRVFELGSGFGYSTAWFARAVAQNGGGTVHHVVWEERLSRMARARLSELGFDGVVSYHVGEAVETLRAAEGPFDIIFNDIDKEQYPAALPVITDKLRPGGLLIADNVLWSGRVLDVGDQTPETNGIREFTRALVRDPRWTASVAPLRDGLLVARLTESQR